MCNFDVAAYWLARLKVCRALCVKCVVRRVLFRRLDGLHFCGNCHSDGSRRLGYICVEQLRCVVFFGRFVRRPLVFCRLFFIRLLMHYAVPSCVHSFVHLIVPLFFCLFVHWFVCFFGCLFVGLFAGLVFH